MNFNIIAQFIKLYLEEATSILKIIMYLMLCFLRKKSEVIGLKGEQH